MTQSSSAATARDQDNVWAYFQTDGASIFDYAVPRLNHLFERAQKLAGGRPLRVLNIGIGNGWLEARCRAEGWQAVALDPVFAAAKGAAAKGTPATIGGIEALPFADGVFDVVFCSEVLEHLTDELLDRGLPEIRRVLKPNGRLLGTVPFEEPLELKTTVCPECSHVHHAYGHHQSFSTKRLVGLFESAGLKSEGFSIRAFPGFRRRNLVGKAKSLVWEVLGRLGAQAADAKIVFAARA